jgi:hypothetical protein
MAVTPGPVFHTFDQQGAMLAKKVFERACSDVGEYLVVLCTSK